MSREPIDFLLAGVGGQGATLAGDVLSHVGLAAGYWVKSSEIHGMSQRGGSVEAHVRWGGRVFSPVAFEGEADVLLAFEKVEALRCAGRVRPGALCIVDWRSIVPVSVTSGGNVYPSDDVVRQRLAAVSDKVFFVNGEKIATEAGDVRTSNVVLLGALSAALERYGLSAVPERTWLEVLEGRVPPRYVETNERAFLAGRGAIRAPNSSALCNREQSRLGGESPGSAWPRGGREASPRDEEG